MKPEKEDKVFDGKKIALSVSGTTLLVVIVSVLTVFLMNNMNKQNETTRGDVTAVVDEPEEEKTPEKISLQLTVDKWLDTLSNRNNAEVMIYDLDNSDVVARYNEDKSIYIASIYKMFVAYEGYYRIDHGVWNADDAVGLGNNYDGKPMTYGNCLDYAIRYSYSPCAENLWSKIGHDSLQSIYNEKGFTGTNIQGITSTPSDLVKLYQMFWKHSDLSEESWEKIQDSMLNQTAPSNAFSAMKQDWRKGFPSGFSAASVYDKVGWWGDGNGNWYYYADAAFVTFPETKDSDGEKVPERNYIMIVLTQNTKPEELVKLGRNIESAVKAADNY